MFGFLLAGVDACGTAQKSSRPPRPQPQPTFPTAHVTARQVVTAMNDDNFFADYGQTTLLIRGTVASVNRHGHDTVIGLGTTLPAKVLCDLGSRRPSVRVRDVITIESVNPQRAASRVSAGVMLTNCRIHER